VGVYFFLCDFVKGFCVEDVNWFLDLDCVVDCVEFAVGYY